MFKDPIAPKQCKKEMNTRYSQPFENKGENYGTGFNVRVGSFGNAKDARNAVPSGVKVMDLTNEKIET